MKSSLNVQTITDHYLPFCMATLMAESEEELKSLLMKVKEDGEGNGNPLQYSCLENPMDGAW